MNRPFGSVATAAESSATTIADIFLTEVSVGQGGATSTFEPLLPLEALATIESIEAVASPAVLVPARKECVARAVALASCPPQVLPCAILRGERSDTLRALPLLGEIQLALRLRRSFIARIGCGRG
jgi:hypothetical protein